MNYLFLPMEQQLSFSLCQDRREKRKYSATSTDKLRIENTPKLATM
jgi:hypothetical protein